MEARSLALFKRGQEMAAQQGLILVDTKYEFGYRGEEIILIDEIHTPDSSRYFYKDGYEERQRKGEPQRQLSKEFVRKWLIEKGDDHEAIAIFFLKFIDNISSCTTIQDSSWRRKEINKETMDIIKCTQKYSIDLIVSTLTWLFTGN